jgi:redox-sensing transcriptional repressor
MSSAQIGQRTGITSGQVRKDLSYFGEFGKPGLGYLLEPLLDRLRHILQLQEERRLVIVGAGNLGSALAGYGGFKESGFRVAAIFDDNYNKIGRRLWDYEILDVSRLPEVVAREQVEIGVITTPAEAAQEVANRMVEAGINVILNFAPARVQVPSPAVVRHVDLTRELEVLCFFLPRRAPAETALGS